MPGALQVLAAPLHGVQTVSTSDTLKLTAFGSLKLKAIQVSEATAAFQEALLLHELWVGPLPVCLAEHHDGRVRRLRLVLATESHLAETACLQDGKTWPPVWVCPGCASNSRMACCSGRASVRPVAAAAH